MVFCRAVFKPQQLNNIKLRPQKYDNEDQFLRLIKRHLSFIKIVGPTDLPTHISNSHTAIIIQHVRTVSHVIIQCHVSLYNAQILMYVFQLPRPLCMCSNFQDSVTCHYTAIYISSVINTTCLYLFSIFFSYLSLFFIFF